MTDPSLETSLETLNITGQQQPVVSNAPTSDEIDKVCQIRQRRIEIQADFLFILPDSRRIRTQF